MSNEAKKVEISIGINVGNGRWDEGKVEKTVHVEHVIDVGLLNDPDTFTCVMDSIRREFDAGIRNAVDEVTVQMVAKDSKTE